MASNPAGGQLTLAQLQSLRAQRDRGEVSAKAYARAVARAQAGVLGEPAHPRHTSSAPAASSAPNRADGAAELKRALLAPGRQSVVLAAKGATSNDTTVPRPDYLKPGAQKSLRRIADVNPDASLALSHIRRLAITDHRVRVLAVGPDGPLEEEHEEGMREIAAFLARCFRTFEGGGVTAMMSVGLDSAATGGAVAVELDVAPNRADVRDIWMVDPGIVEMERVRDGDTESIIPVLSDGMGGKGKPFNLQQFAYIGLDTNTKQPHGKPWFAPALDTTLPQHEMRNTLQAVVKNQGFGRLAAKVSWDRIAELMPDTVASGTEAASFIEQVMDGVRRSLERLEADDTVIHPDFVDLDYYGANHSGNSFRPKDLSDVYDTDQGAAVKTPLALLGRSTGNALSSNADIHWVVYALSVEALRDLVNRAIQWALSQVLRIKGIPAVVVIEWDPIRKEDRVAEANASKAEHEAVLAMWDRGLIDDETARERLGYPEPQGANTRPAPAAANAATPPARADADDADATARFTGLVKCTKCGGTSWRRTTKHRQQCLGCGAYQPKPAQDKGDPERAPLDPWAGVWRFAEALQSADSDAFLGAYVDAVGDANHVSLCGCSACRAEREPVRGPAFQPKDRTPVSAVELAQEFTHIDTGDVRAAVEAWRAWARQAAPRYVRLLDAVLAEDEDDEDRVDRGPATTAPDYEWDGLTQRFRDAGSGRFVGEAVVNNLLERRIRDVERDIDRLTTRLLDDRINPAEFGRGMASLLRDAHLAARELAVGGAERMTPRHSGSVGGYMRYDTDHLAGFVNAIARGDLSPEQIRARGRLYAGANLRREFDRGRAWSHEEAGYSEERRVLRQGAAHCKGCADEAARGWMAIGTGTPIGGHECGPNDMCGREYRFDKNRRYPPRRVDAPRAVPAHS